jgi:NAD(P)-dependent dehydrogenase (short-subunit alcohol dehydrogenase family)
MPRPLENQVAIVTGAAKGIGRGIALKLASLGATIGIVYNSSSVLAEQVRARIVGIYFQTIVCSMPHPHQCSLYRHLL